MVTLWALCVIAEILNRRLSDAYTVGRENWSDDLTTTTEPMSVPMFAGTHILCSHLVLNTERLPQRRDILNSYELPSYFDTIG